MSLEVSATRVGWTDCDMLCCDGRLLFIWDDCIMRLETSRPGLISERSDTTELDIWRKPLRLTCAFLPTLGVGVCGLENPVFFLQKALHLSCLTAVLADCSSLVQTCTLHICLLHRDTVAQHMPSVRTCETFSPMRSWPACRQCHCASSYGKTCRRCRLLLFEMVL